VVGSGTDTMNVDDTGSTGAKTGTLTSTTLTGLGTGASGITYSGLATLNISLGSGGNTFTIASTYSATVTTLNSGSGADTVNLLSDADTTNINTQAGDDVINVQTTGATTNINTGSGTNTVNVGSLAPATGGIVNGIQGALIVVGSGTDTMNVDDTGSTSAKTGTLTSTTLTGLGMVASGITYSGLATLNLSLGSGNDTFNVQSTFASTVTTLNTGLGMNMVNVGSTMPTVGGIVDGIQGALIVVGSGSDIMNVDDTGSTMAKTGNLTSTKLTGLGLGVSGITYSGLATLNISLGSGGNTFTIASTYSTTVTILNSGSGNDTVNLLSDADTTSINTQAGNDVINVLTTSAITNINTGIGTNTINVGSTMPTVGGTVDGIQGALTIMGGGNDTLNVDDTGSTSAKTGNLTSMALTGLGMGNSGIAYNGLATLNISLGSGGNTFTISSTYLATVTTLNSGSGADTVNLLSDANTTNVNTQAGNDVINVQTTGARTNVNTGAGTNTINVGSTMPTVGGIVDGIQGALVVAGSGSDVLNVDDTGSTGSKTGMLSPATLTGLGMGSSGITYIGLVTLNISLGSGGNTFTITSTYLATVTTLNSGSGVDTVNLLNDANTTNINTQAGNDVINIRTTGATTTVNTGSGTNTVNVGSKMPTVGGIVDGIQGALIIVASGNDALNVDDTGSTSAKTGTLTSTMLTGLGMGSSGITYGGIATLVVTLGAGNDTFNITSVNAATNTTIDGGLGTNVAVVNINGNLNNNLTLLRFAYASFYINGDFSGVLNYTGPITTLTITGSFTSTGIINAGSIATMTVGGDLAGSLTVTGLLGTLAVGGGAPGVIVAGSINIITVAAGYGNVVLNVTEGGIQREILATPVAGGTMPGTVHFAFVYDSQTTATPQLAIQITDTHPVARSYNLALVVLNSSSAEFNLTLINSYLNRATGISNISVEGSLINKLTAPEVKYFTGLTLSSRVGVVLPIDNITGVEVSNTLPMGVINVASIEGIAFGIVTSSTGTVVNVTNPLAQGTALTNLLGSAASVHPALDAFVVPFSSNHVVRLYVHDNTTLNLVQIMTLTDQLANNLSVIAYIVVLPTTNNNVNPLVQSVTLVGSGGSINSILSIANITSTGALGDVTITASAGSTINNAAGLGNITALTIFGNLSVTNAGIYGTIQTTNGDLGSVVKNTSGVITGVTSITAKGNITGQIIVRGNLISSISTNGSFSGVIAVQGDVGIIKVDGNGNAVLTKNALTRFGGISISGNNSGQIVVLGNLFGNFTVNGTMTGRLAVEGRAVAGLVATRKGILGTVNISSFALGAAVVSGGLIGDSVGATTAHFGGPKGFVAAAGAVNLSSTNFASGLLLQNQTGANLAMIQAIFTNGGSALAFDTGGTLNGLNLIKTDLKNLQDKSGVLSGPVA